MIKHVDLPLSRNDLRKILSQIDLILERDLHDVIKQDLNRLRMRVLMTVHFGR